jgi:hypothetical protein
VAVYGINRTQPATVYAVVAKIPASPVLRHFRSEVSTSERFREQHAKRCSRMRGFCSSLATKLTLAECHQEIWESPLHGENLFNFILHRYTSLLLGLRFKWYMLYTVQIACEDEAIM